MGFPSVTIANLVEYDIPFENNDISQCQVQPQRDSSKDIHSIDPNIKVMAEAFTYVIDLRDKKKDVELIFYSMKGTSIKKKRDHEREK